MLLYLYTHIIWAFQPCILIKCTENIAKNGVRDVGYDLTPPTPPCNKRNVAKIWTTHQAKHFIHVLNCGWSKNVSPCYNRNFVWLCVTRQEFTSWSRCFVISWSEILEMNCWSGLLYQICVCEIYFILKTVSLCLFNFGQPINTTIHSFQHYSKVVRVSFHLFSGDTWLGLSGRYYLCIGHFFRVGSRCRWHED